MIPTSTTRRPRHRQRPQRISSGTVTLQQLRATSHAIGGRQVSQGLPAMRRNQMGGQTQRGSPRTRAGTQRWCWIHTHPSTHLDQRIMASRRRRLPITDRPRGPPVRAVLHGHGPRAGHRRAIRCCGLLRLQARVSSLSPGEGCSYSTSVGGQTHPGPSPTASRPSPVAGGHMWPSTQRLPPLGST